MTLEKAPGWPLVLQGLKICQCELLSSESVGFQKAETQHFSGQGVRPRVSQEVNNYRPTVTETHVGFPQMRWLLRWHLDVDTTPSLDFLVQGRSCKARNGEEGCVAHSYIVQAQQREESKHMRDALYTPLAYRHRA